MFLSAQALSVFITVIVFFMLRPLFSSSAGILAELVQTGSVVEHSNIFVEMLKKLVPASFLNPFLDSDMLQLLVMGIMFGIAIRAANAADLRTIFEESYAVFTKLLMMIMKFVPLLVLCSIMDQVLLSGFSIIAKLAWLAAIAMVSFLAMGAVYLSCCWPERVYEYILFPS